MHRPSDSLEAQNPAEFSDKKLIAGLRLVVSSQCRTTARLIAFMAEVDARGLYRGFAYGSMFEYAVDVLHMSEGEAFPRIYAGRIARRYPAVLSMLERGELHLSGIRLIGPLLTPENHAELLEAVRFKSKREIEKVVAARSPRDDVRSGLRRLPERRPADEPERASVAMTLDLQLRERAHEPLAAPPAGAASSQPASVQIGDAAGAAATSVICAMPVVAPPATPFTAANPPKPAAAAVAPTIAAQDARVESGPPGSLASQSDAQARTPSRDPGARQGGVTMTPLRTDRYKVQFTADQRLHDKIKQAQHLLRGQLPSGDLAEVVERALDLLIAERMKQRFAVGRTPAAAKASVAKASAAKDPEVKSAGVQPAAHRPSRHIPAEVRRQVVARDGMQCTFVSAAGKRCELRGDLEFHHEHPFGRGGETSVANVRLLCAPHNGLLAERDYGREFIRQRIDDSLRGVRDAAFYGDSRTKQVAETALDSLSASPALRHTPVVSRAQVSSMRSSVLQQR